jgi:hypothetical protein
MLPAEIFINATPFVYEGRAKIALEAAGHKLRSVNLCRYIDLFAFGARKIDLQFHAYRRLESPWVVKRNVRVP